MNSYRYSIAIVLTFILSSSVIAGWKADLDSLVVNPYSLRQQQFIQKIIKAKPDWHEVVSYLENITFPPAKHTGLIERTTTCIDNIQRPYVLYVPSEYDPSKPTPLFVYLHGGVSRSDIAGNIREYASDNPFFKLAEEKGWFIIFPMGQAGATWWDKVGMANIENLIRTVKHEFNIDDDRVWLGGFSDGASASFLQAMVNPTDYGALVALNGHMGVASEDGGMLTYAPNFFNTPIYATTADNDRLYPSHRMRATIDMALRAGGDIFYRELEGEHSLSSIESEIPLIARFLERHPRNPFPNRIVWETADGIFGECRWFAIDRVSISEPEPWHVDYNVALIDSNITIGFIPADWEDSTAVKVDRVVEGDYLANRIGLQAGDVIIKGNNMEIKSFDDLVAFKSKLSRGDFVELVIKRDNKMKLLKGDLPQPRNYYLFHRNQPSALAKVSFASNRIDIEASQMAAFSILIHPDMIRLEKNLEIKVNDKLVFDDEITPDLEFILSNFLKNRDRRLIYVDEVKIEL